MVEFDREVEVWDSENIDYMGYVFETKVLHIRFLSGRTYEYYDVSPAAFGALVASESIGAAFNLNIRDKFEYKELVTEESTS